MLLLWLPELGPALQWGWGLQWGWCSMGLGLPGLWPVKNGAFPASAARSVHRPLGPLHNILFISISGYFIS